MAVKRPARGTRNTNSTRRLEERRASAGRQQLKRAMGSGNAKGSPVDENAQGIVPSAGGDAALEVGGEPVENWATADGSEQEEETVEQTTDFVFELIPFYSETDKETASQIIETLESVTAQGINIDTRDGFGNTLLMMSVHHQKAALVSWALSQGSNIDAINFAGVCAMHIACHESSGSFQLVEILVKHGANLEIPDANGCTVLHYAASAGDQQLASFLLNSGSNPLQRDVNNFLPLDYALESGSEQCVSILLDAQESKANFNDGAAQDDDLDDLGSDFTFSGRTTNTNFVDESNQDSKWEEYIDGHSNTPYYYNVVTGETTWEKPAALEGKTSMAAIVSVSEGHFNGNDGGDSLRELPDGLQEKSKKKKKKKKKKKDSKGSGDKKTQEVDEVKTSRASAANTRAQNNLALWRRVAWRVGIKKVTAKRRKLAIQAAREAMMMEQQAMQEKRDAELKLKLAEEEKRRASQASSLQERQIAQLREEFMKKEQELKLALEKERSRTSALDDKIKQKQKERADEIKRREEESRKREAARVAELESKMKKQNEDLQAMQSKLEAAHGAGKSAEDNLKAQIAEREAQIEKERLEVERWRKEHEAESKKRASMNEALRKEQHLRKKYYNEMEDMKGKIRVYCRVRPMLKSEKERNCSTCVEIPDDETVNVEVKERNTTKTFSFDKIYNSAATQNDIFSDTKKLVQSAIDGYNVCIFAYGQTGTGKTYTITGDRNDPDHMGIMPRAFTEIFDIAKRDSEKMSVKVRMYMLELYCDTLLDLLTEHDSEDGGNPPPKIVIRKNEYGTVMPQGVMMKDASNAADLFKVRSIAAFFGLHDLKKFTLPRILTRCLSSSHAVFLSLIFFFLDSLVLSCLRSTYNIQQILDQAMAQRHVAATKMNSESSRSHLIVSILLDVEDRNTGGVLTGKLTLVDLAGSERVKKSGAKAQAMKEAQSINKSLSSLGNVVNAITQEHKHVPYRSNLLTQLMSDSLGGNAKVQMFVNLSPADYNAQESEMSLMYATRIKSVKNSGAADMAIVNKLKKQIAQLKAVQAKK